MHRWHLANGWVGIGYHFFVSKDGKVYQGRPINTIGAHCSGHNSHSIGICAEGDFTYDKMGKTQKQAIVKLIGYCKSRYPQAAVVGHKELGVTGCPGDNYPSYRT